MTTALREDIKWTPHIKVVKYEPESVERLTAILGHEPTGPELRAMEELGQIEPDEIVEDHGNVLLIGGILRIANLIVGTASTPAFTAAQGFVGVGDSATAATQAQSNLQAATNKWYQAIDAAPSVNGTTGLISANCTITGSNGNFAWNEWCWGIATGTITAGSATPGTSPTILNRKAQTLGTKASGAVWTLQASVQLT